jgi:hypothetical protein
MRIVLRHNETSAVMDGSAWGGPTMAELDGGMLGSTEVWARRLSLLISVEIRAAVIDQTLTHAEAEQLLARLVLVVDQAITTPQR